MLTQVQAAFREPARPREVADERLIIHQRTDPSKATHLVIFVHGLGGVRYGKKATWGDFPRLVFEDFPGVDVGMYAYRTLLRRWKFWRSIDLEDEAMTFSDSFKGLTNYRSLLLLGHSMGGILCNLLLPPRHKSTRAGAGDCDHGVACSRLNRRRGDCDQGRRKVVQRAISS